MFFSRRAVTLGAGRLLLSSFATPTAAQSVLLKCLRTKCRGSYDNSPGGL